MVIHLQELGKRVEHNNTEGVEHGKDEPDVNHLDVGSHGQRLGDINETMEKVYSQVLNVVLTK